ncbi:MAG: hypothetical protein IT320_23930 [Anaerolineae bacterium]|nr:hypothetical protein [Anaerolineae bacterium]
MNHNHQTTPGYPNGAQTAAREASESERNAMRAYLQRTEVRLSTLHRIAVAFVSGAGLLLLFPLLLKDEFGTLLRVFIDFAVDQLPALAASQQLVAALMVTALAYPFILSALIPIYALYLVLKDIVHFYYTIYTPGYPSSLLTPSFALSGITFSPDEAPEMKKRVYAAQYDPNAVNFMIPFSAEKRELYFTDTIASTHGDVIPQSRQWQSLSDLGVLPPDADRQTIDHFNAAFGLARTLDRDLVAEVANAESSVVRHVLYLRRLVLRYVKALLMVIWTTVVSFAIIPFLQHEKLPTFLLLGVSFTIWSLFVMPIMSLPVKWIYRHRAGDEQPGHLDRQLTMLEQHMEKFCIPAIPLSLLGLILSLLFYR